MFYSHSYNGTEKWVELTGGFTLTMALHHVSKCKTDKVKQTARGQISMTYCVEYLR